MTYLVPQRHCLLVTMKIYPSSGAFLLNVDLTCADSLYSGAIVDLYAIDFDASALPIHCFDFAYVFSR